VSDQSTTDQSTTDQSTTNQSTTNQSTTEQGASDRDNRRKVREGLVVSSRMDKTVVVAVTDRVRHPRYDKTVQRTKRLYAHDESNDAKVGDRVRIAETRPVSKLKRWRVVEVLERAR
jgi:small subunit ribosomal protein S17